MPDHPAVEERERAHPLRPVNHLVRHDEVPRPHLLLEAADGREGNDSAHTQVPQGRDVGARRDLMRGEFVVRAVAGEEGDGDGAAGCGGGVVQDRDGGGGRAPGSGDIEDGGEGEVGERLEAGAPDYGYADGIWMVCLLAVSVEGCKDGLGERDWTIPS